MIFFFFFCSVSNQLAALLYCECDIMHSWYTELFLIAGNIELICLIIYHIYYHQMNQLSWYLLQLPYCSRVQWSLLVTTFMLDYMFSFEPCLVCVLKLHLPSVKTFWVSCIAIIILHIQITKSDIMSQRKWALSLVITDGHIDLHQGFVWVCMDWYAHVITTENTACLNISHLKKAIWRHL